MTKCDINVLYVELNRLLEDICDFLSCEVQEKKLSVKSIHEANLLIQRSKKQLVNIAKVSTDNDSGRYVDMRPPNNGIPNENDMSQIDIYSVIPEDERSKTPAQNFEIVQCPFDNMAAQNIPNSFKQGWLERREKFLFIGHQRKVYASVMKHWMGIYHSDKDSKPMEIINLSNFEAKQIECPKNNKHMFELISKSDECKNCTFHATTNKDVLQWVTAINNNQAISHEVEYEYDGVVNVPREPVLPPRKPNVPKPTIQNWDPQKRPVPTVPSEKSLVEKESSEVEDSSALNSFSETDSDAEYDQVLIMDKNNRENMKRDAKSNNEKVSALIHAMNVEDDVEYDEVLTVPLPAKPPLVKEEKIKVSPNKPKLKPKPTLKLFK